MNLHFLGYIGAAIMAFSSLPQVMQSCAKKSSKDSSFIWKVCFLIGKFAYIIYISHVSSLPIIIFICIEAAMTTFLLLSKIIYNLKK